MYLKNDCELNVIQSKVKRATVIKECEPTAERWCNFNSFPAFFLSRLFVLPTFVY